ncbi:MAG: hypothetical protein ACPL7I_02565, partial [Myxococcota bacterium]
MSRSIVIACPDKQIGFNIQNYIRDSRWPVEIFESGKEIFDYVKKNKVAMAVITSTLSDMSGYSICNRIKKDSKLKNIPVFLLLNDENREPFEQHKNTIQKADEYFEDISDLQKISNRIIEVIGQPKEEDLAEKEDIAMAIESAIDTVTFSSDENPVPPP